MEFSENSGSLLNYLACYHLVLSSPAKDLTTNNFTTKAQGEDKRVVSSYQFSQEAKLFGLSTFPLRKQHSHHLSLFALTQSSFHAIALLSQHLLKQAMRTPWFSNGLGRHDQVHLVSNWPNTKVKGWTVQRGLWNWQTLGYPQVQGYAHVKDMPEKAQALTTFWSCDSATNKEKSKQSYELQEIVKTFEHHRQTHMHISTYTHAYPHSHTYTHTYKHKHRHTNTHIQTCTLSILMKAGRLVISNPFSKSA